MWTRGGEIDEGGANTSGTMSSAWGAMGAEKAIAAREKRSTMCIFCQRNEEVTRRLQKAQPGPIFLRSTLPHPIDLSS